jgi:hypothetical protein
VNRPEAPSNRASMTEPDVAELHGAAPLIPPSSPAAWTPVSLLPPFASPGTAPYTGHPSFCVRALMARERQLKEPRFAQRSRLLHPVV